MPEHELTYVTLCFHSYTIGNKTKYKCFLFFFLELFIHSSGHNFTLEYNKFTTKSQTNTHTKKQSNFHSLRMEERKLCMMSLFFSFTLNTVCFFKRMVLSGKMKKNDNCHY